MAVALSGSVIIQSEGQKVSYKEKCEKCGNVQQRTVNTLIAPNATRTTSYKCTKCGNQQKVVIKG